MAVAALVITGAGGLIVIVRVIVPVPPAFVAPKTTADVPVTVGIPVIAPVEELILRPAGNPAAVKLVGEFVAVTV